MDVEIRVMRVRGRRVSKSEEPQVLRGELRGNWREYKLYHFGQATQGGAEPLAKLYCAELLGMDGPTFYLRGYEEDRRYLRDDNDAGAAVMQEWECSLTKPRGNESGPQFHQHYGHGSPMGKASLPGQSEPQG